MRITNKDYTPLEVLAEVLAYQPTAIARTARFTEKDLSNHDFILAELRDRVEAILNSFERLGTESCVLQSPDDKGVDLLMKFQDGGRERRLGFQIKGNREADLDAARDKASKLADPEASLVKTLKRNAFEARRKVTDWWVFPCFNASKHKRRLAAISTSFTLDHDPAWPVRVIPPEQALGLLEMSTEDVEAICTRLLCRDDEVLRAARFEFEGLSRAAQLIVHETFSDALDGDVEISDRTFFEAISEEPGSVDAADVLSELQSHGYVRREDVEAPYIVDAHAFPALCALYFEGRVRHEMSAYGAITFMWRLLDDIYPGRAATEEKAEDSVE